MKPEEKIVALKKQTLDVAKLLSELNTHGKKMDILRMLLAKMKDPSLPEEKQWLAAICYLVVLNHGREVTK